MVTLVHYSTFWLYSVHKHNHTNVWATRDLALDWDACEFSLVWSVCDLREASCLKTLKSSNTAPISEVSLVSRRSRRLDSPSNLHSTCLRVWQQDSQTTAPKVSFNALPGQPSFSCEFSLSVGLEIEWVQSLELSAVSDDAHAPWDVIKSSPDLTLGLTDVTSLVCGSIVTLDELSLCLEFTDESAE